MIFGGKLKKIKEVRVLKGHRTVKLRPLYPDIIYPPAGICAVAVDMVTLSSRIQKDVIQFRFSHKSEIVPSSFNWSKEMSNQAIWRDYTLEFQGMASLIA